MNTEAYIIREISPEDNPQIAEVIREVLVEFGVPKVGTAYEDKSLECMYETYQGQHTIYYVIEYKGSILGGAGIAPLANYASDTCEFQKMYFLKEARGKGLGTKMIECCLKKAKEFGYKQCYLETMPYMDAARALYAKNGFSYLEHRMGDTGHYSCNVWMLKPL